MVLVGLAFIYSMLTPIIRGDISPQIIGYGHIKHDLQTDKYFVEVEYDTNLNKITSPKYFINEYISAILPLFPVKCYITEENIGDLVTIFTSDKLIGHHIAIGINDAYQIEHGFSNIFLEVVSYHRNYYLLIMFYAGLFMLFIPQLKKYQ